MPGERKLVMLDSWRGTISTVTMFVLCLPLLALVTLHWSENWIMDFPPWYEIWLIKSQNCLLSMIMKTTFWRRRLDRHVSLSLNKDTFILRICLLVFNHSPVGKWIRGQMFLPSSYVFSSSISPTDLTYPTMHTTCSAPLFQFHSSLKHLFLLSPMNISNM